MLLFSKYGAGSPDLGKSLAQIAHVSVHGPGHTQCPTLVSGEMQTGQVAHGEHRHHRDA